MCPSSQLAVTQLDKKALLNLLKLHRDKHEKRGLKGGMTYSGIQGEEDGILRKLITHGLCLYLICEPIRIVLFHMLNLILVKS